MDISLHCLASSETSVKAISAPECTRRLHSRQVGLVTIPVAKGRDCSPTDQLGKEREWWGLSRWRAAACGATQQ